MPPEYANHGYVSPTFDAFSFGVIIIRIVDGNKGNCRRSEMPRQQFIDRVRLYREQMSLIFHIMCYVLRFFTSARPIFLILYDNIAGN